MVILGIDPDVNGSMAVFQWLHAPLASPLVLDLSTAEIHVYDMPHVFYTLKGKSKAGKVVSRKYAARSQTSDPYHPVQCERHFVPSPIRQLSGRGVQGLFRAVGSITRTRTPHSRPSCAMHAAPKCSHPVWFRHNRT